MTLVAEKAAPASTRNGPSEISQLGSFDGSEPKTSLAHTQATSACLHREFSVEALRVVAVKAAHAADDLELGDDICAARNIGIVVAHIREAAKSFRELERLMVDASHE